MPAAAAADGFLAAVDEFRAWAARAYPVSPCGGEWECDYPGWHLLRDAWAELLAVPLAGWGDAVIDAALYAIARDNEDEWLAAELPRDALVPLAALALARGEPDACWQLAVELATLARAEAEPTLLRLVEHGHEYVRRRALASLARLGSPQVPALALREWAAASDERPWPRMNALWAWHRVGAPDLAPHLAEALASPNTALRGFAERLRLGHVND